MASIRKRGDRWQAQVRRLGFPLRSKSFLTKRDAEVWVRQVELQVDRRELPPDRAILAKTKLADLVTRYRDEVTPRKKGTEQEKSVLDKFLRHAICQKPLSQLMGSDFAAYRDERLEEVSSATLRRQLNPIHNMFKVAKDEWNYPLGDNPLDKVKFTVIDNRRERRLRTGEIERLTEAANETRNGLVLPVVLFALETALRRGEILNVGWHHIDLERRSLVIPESKNGHSRVIPLTANAVRILERMDRDQEKPFPVTPNAFRLAWQRLTRRAKIDDLHFHDLRHEAISRFFEMGLTIPEVASISGHRVIRMLMRYGHADPANLLKKMDSGQPESAPTSNSLSEGSIIIS